MKKVLNFLEQYVQLLALALGTLYVVYIAWIYLLQPPVSVKVNGRTYGPGEIDDAIMHGPAGQLEKQMNDSTPPNWSLPGSTQITDKFYPPGNQPALPGRWIGGSPSVPKEIVVVQNQIGTIDDLPVPPPPTFIRYTTGRSTCSLPDPQAQGKTISIDKDWISLAFKVDMTKAAAEFERVKIPQTSMSTSILKVELTRSEKLPNGQWSSPQVIRPLPINELRSFPPANAPIGELKGFAAWARDKSSITRPDFYAITAGDKWSDPTALPAEKLPAPKAKEAPIVVEQPISPAYRTAPPTGGHTAPPPPVRTPVKPKPTPKPAPVKVPPAKEIIPPVQENPPAPGPVPVPAAMPKSNLFDPSRPGDAFIVAHDDTVQPGKTYRYCLKYTIKNPVLGKREEVAVPALAEQLGSDSVSSTWTDAISIPPRTYFFIVQRLINTHDAAFKVYHWTDGNWKDHEFRIALGDVVGQIIKDVDFRTEYTLIDIHIERSQGGDDENYLLLMDEAGQVTRRTYFRDTLELNNFKKTLPPSAPPAKPLPPVP